MLLSMLQKRWVFTNSDREHARRVMEKIGIQDCFQGLIDIYALEPHCKPQKEASPEAHRGDRKALQFADTSDPSGCMLLDDSRANLATAHQKGFFTALVGTETSDPNADRALGVLGDLPEACPEIWDGHAG